MRLISDKNTEKGKRWSCNCACHESIWGQNRYNFTHS